MLSYQHHYHAGSLSDIHKHGLLIKLIKALTIKDRPLSYMETHSGRGFYDLACWEAQKTGEAKEGIESLLAKNSHPDLNDDYLNLIKLLRIEFSNPSFYPGSPLIAKRLLRPQDELFLMELHPGEIKHLQGLRKINGPKTNIHHRDGYEGVLAVAPPKNRRGLVLIDPSYEVKSEYNQVAEFCIKLHKKWPESIIMIWYPILNQGYHESMKDNLNLSFDNTLHTKKSSRIEHNKTITIEGQPTPAIFYDEKFFKSTGRALGSGVAIINNPWKTN